MLNKSQKIPKIFKTLRIQTITLIILILFCLIFFINLIVENILHTGSDQLESQYSEEHMERLKNQINDKIVNIDATCEAWATWDESYKFMEDRNNEYIESNLEHGVLQNLDINLIMYASLSGKIFYAKFVDLSHDESELAIPDTIVQYLVQNTLLKYRPKGIFLLPEGPLMFAARPILTSEGEGSVKGYLVMGRILDEQNINNMKSNLKLDFGIQNIVLPEHNDIFDTITDESRIIIRKISETEIVAYSVMNDIYGQAAIGLNIQMARGINRIVSDTLISLLIFLIIGCVAFTLIIVLFLERNVLSRLFDLSVNIKNIGDNSAFSNRLIKGKRSDELSIVTLEVNNMLDKLDATQQELQKSKDMLEIKVQERTGELARKNIDLLNEITEHKKTRQKIEYLAYHDHLTDLPNRMLFKDRLEQSINLAKRIETNIAIIFLDLDAFKIINDSMGHEKGDELLKEVAKNLGKIIRNGDTISRFGGDEFIIMAQNIKSMSSIRKIADRILNVFTHPFSAGGMECRITVSIGIAIYPYDGEDVETLIKNSDLAMYKSKEKGGNKYEFCTSAMKSKAIDTMKLTNRLYRALDNNELLLYYQPQVSCSTGKIVGVEALLRWNNPELGFVPPSAFIHIAEVTGLILPIGEWVLRTACSQNKIFQDSGFDPVRIAVNLSMIQLQKPGIVKQVADILDETGLPSKYLEIEITESVMMMETETLISTLDRFKEMGVSISIDDFGTEYSSLNYLKRLPVDRLKIAMPFVHGISVNDKDEAITKAIIILAGSLGLKVIAEGVETKQQLDFLTNCVCDEIQGYYYYKPMPAKQLEELLRKQVEEFRY